MLLEYSDDSVEALMLNDAFYETMDLDWSTCEPYRTRVPELVEPEDRPVLHQTLEQTVRQGMDLCVVRVSKALHPEDRWIRMVVRRVSSGDKSHFLFALMTDVTQQHELRMRRTRCPKSFGPIWN